ncbi:unnamed protein product [Lymnaea stagnalis]|uniref:F-box/LRR-repeat protein 5 n=1 Tax=Lymnaea stagnalis TaxID=6523 RepID=A0AAV2IF74_LYMST
MAPRWPEEVDVFSVPHSRMKKLVHKYSDLITTTDFRDEDHLTTLLENLKNVFSEFKAHERIENMLIMKRLRIKLRAASVTSAAVCNCHSDNRLTDMLDLVLDGYRWTQKTERERQLYGRKLRHALEDFTQNFIPHMEEEEEVFQPMLMQYFSYEELKELKAKVIQQHCISKQHEDYLHEKFVADSCECNIYVCALMFKVFFSADESCDTESIDQDHFSQLPNEIFQQIFSYLGPKDLARVGQVSQRWNHLSKDPSLWSKLYPVHWAQGNWSFFPEPVGGVDGPGFGNKIPKDLDGTESYICLDEDADIDDSGDSDETDSVDSDVHKQILKEAKMLTGIVKYLLPHVGQGVKVCDLAYSRGLSSSLVHKILKLCPNLEVLDLTHTKVGDAAFKEYGSSGRMSRLRHLDLTGCENITDLTLFSLAYLGSDRFDDDKDRIEIENLPAYCLYKQPTCCGRQLTCGKSQVDETTSEKRIENVCCRSKELSCTEKQINLAGGHHTASAGDVSTGDTNRSGCPQSCDLSYVYLDMLIESDGNILTECSPSLSQMSLTSPSLSQMSLRESIHQMTLVGDLTLAHKTFGVSDMSLSQRTCGDGAYQKHESVNSCCQKTLICDNIGKKEAFSAGHSTFVNKTDSSWEVDACNIEFLSLNGCYRISDEGLCALANGMGAPNLLHLDVSGCTAVTGYGLSQLVSTSSRLDHANLFYCVNMSNDPYPTTASGCRNLQCESRFCCSLGE